MALKHSAKTEKFDIRLSEQEQTIIKQAAELQRTTPTSFIRQQAVVAAESVIHDQTRFVLNDKQWKLVENALNQPARVLPKLRGKLAKSDDWDQ